MQIILGSQSPRRKEILDYFSLPFIQVASHFDEDSISFDGYPAEYARTLAIEKGRCLRLAYPEAVIITADTVVFHAGKSYGKPADEKDAFRMLSELSGNWHSVFTALGVRKGVQEYAAVEETKVLFNPLSPEQIRTYFNATHLMDKAGSYAIQTVGGLIVRKIEGCYYNVMGMPVNSLQKLLSLVEVDLWAYMKAKSP